MSKFLPEQLCLLKSTLPHTNTCLVLPNECIEGLRFDAFLLCLPPASPSMLRTLLFSHVHVRQRRWQCVGSDTQGSVFYPKHFGWRNVAACEAAKPVIIQHGRWHNEQRRRHHGSRSDPDRNVTGRAPSLGVASEKNPSLSSPTGA